MAEDKVTRKLTTILAADVEEYTRLMRADEEVTLKTLGDYREIIDGLIARHDGRVFSTGGDSVLAEFASVVEAVRCAIACQEELSSRNAELADDRKMMFPRSRRNPLDLYYRPNHIVVGTVRTDRLGKNFGQSGCVLPDAGPVRIGEAGSHYPRFPGKQLELAESGSRLGCR